MARDTATSRQAKYGSYAALYTIIIIAVLIMVNWLANRYNKSYDSTSNKRFTLSDQTKKIVQDLKSDATITYFDQASRFDSARDTLARYKNLSPKIRVDYIDYDKNPTKARAYGLKTAGTAYVELNGKREEVTSITEEGITGAFLRAIKGRARTVCFVQGSNEAGLDESGRNGLSQLKESLEKENYATKAVRLVEQPEVPKDCTVLAVVGPQFDYPEPEVNAIKAYVENGGRALLLLDPPLKAGRTETGENPGLAKVLTSWGVTLDNDLVLDPNPIGQIAGLGPEVPIVTTYESHPIVADLKRTVTAFPLARSLDTKSADKAKVEKLFSSGPSSVATTSLAAQSVSMDDPKNKKGPFTLGAAGTYETGKPNNQGRFVVVGNSGFVQNYFLRFNGNRDLTLNAMNWLSSDEDLISIRPKEPEDRRLSLTGAQLRLFFYLCVIAMPLLMILSGIATYMRRR